MQLEKFASSVPWKNEFSGKLAIFCSDERFVPATLEFLRQHLDIGQCDFIVVPGGATFITQGEGALTERLELLVKAHQLKWVIMIAHDDCGYYKNYHKGLEIEMLRQKQRDDLLQAMRVLQEKGLRSQAFFAYVESGAVTFQEIGK